MKPLILSLMMILPLVAREVPKVEENEPVPLECRIRAVHKGGDDVVTLKVSLENVGESPICVVKPNVCSAMIAEGISGGWRVQFLGPDGEPAKLQFLGPDEDPARIDSVSPTPSFKGSVLLMDKTTMLGPGEFVGMSIPLKGQFADLEKVSEVKVTYSVQRNDKDKQRVVVVDWGQDILPSLWEGKVESQTFDIARFVNSRPKKK